MSGLQPWYSAFQNCAFEHLAASPQEMIPILGSRFRESSKRAFAPPDNYIVLTPSSAYQFRHCPRGGLVILWSPPPPLCKQEQPHCPSAGGGQESQRVTVHRKLIKHLGC